MWSSTQATNSHAPLHSCKCRFTIDTNPPAALTRYRTNTLALSTPIAHSPPKPRAWRLHQRPRQPGLRADLSGDCAYVANRPAAHADFATVAMKKQTKRRWTAREIRLLGTAPDPEIALRLGRTLWAVMLRRGRLHIQNPAPKFRWWTPAEDRLLGTMPDEELARRLNRTVQAVARERKLLRIPGFPRYAPSKCQSSLLIQGQNLLSLWRRLWRLVLVPAVHDMVYCLRTLNAKLPRYG